MTDAPFQRIFDTARAHLPGALDGGMQLELFNVIREFCNRTNAWQEAIPFRLSANRTDYMISASTPSAYIHRLMWCEGKRDASAHPGRAVQAQIHDTAAQTVSLHLRAPISAGDIFHAHVALTIADPTGPTGLPRLPDSLVDDCFDTFLSGLLERMMIQPAKPYSNLQGASYHGRRFRDGMSATRSAVARGHNFGAQAWRFPQTFRTRTQVF